MGTRALALAVMVSACARDAPAEDVPAPPPITAPAPTAPQRPSARPRPQPTYTPPPFEPIANGHHATRHTSRLCALTGQQVHTAGASSPEPMPTDRPEGSAIEVGILVSKAPLVLELAGNKFKMYASSAAVDGVAIGDVVAARLEYRSETRGPELGQSTLVTGITAMTNESDRAGTIVQDARSAKDTMSVMDDGVVMMGDRAVLHLDDDALSKLLATFAAVHFDELPAPPTPYNRDDVVLSCARYQETGLLPDLAPVILALDGLRAKVEDQTHYRLQYGKRERIEWIDWPYPDKPVTDASWTRNVELPAALFHELPEDSLARQVEAGHRFVRDRGKVYLVERGRMQVDPEHPYRTRLTIEACDGTPKALGCRRWPSDTLPIGAAPQSGLPITRAQLENLQLGIRDYLTEYKVEGLVIQGDEVYRQLTMRRIVGREQPVRWHLAHGARRAIVPWPSDAPDVATLMAQRNAGVMAFGKTRGHDGPIYAAIPDSLAELVGAHAVFTDKGVLYDVFRRPCARDTGPCKAGSFYELDSSVMPVEPWRSTELALSAMPAAGVDLTEAQARANQRLLETVHGDYREGDVVYERVHATHAP